MEIFAIITGILTIPVVLLAGRYNLHMFQLNTYMNGEQRAWLGKITAGKGCFWCCWCWES